MEGEVPSILLFKKGYAKIKQGEGVLIMVQNKIARNILVQSHIKQVLDKINSLPLLLTAVEKKDMVINGLMETKEVVIDSYVEKLITAAV